jgi:hypothetical protein
VTFIETRGFDSETKKKAFLSNTLNVSLFPFVNRERVELVVLFTICEIIYEKYKQYGFLRLNIIPRVY